MKTVFIKPRFYGMPLHALFTTIKEHPPSNYRILTAESKINNKFAEFGTKNRSPYLKKLLFHVNGLPYLIYQLNNKIKIPDNIDLVWAASHILNFDKPWIVSLESVDALSAYYSLTFTKSIIEKKLKQENCKSIITFSNWARNTVLNCYENKDIKKKITTIRYTVPSKKFVKKKEDDIIRIFYLGTINPGTLLNYEHKGIYEVVNSFFSLQKKYGHKIELIIRSKVPADLKQKILKTSGIRLIENKISSEDLQRLFITSDIFPHVGYETANLSILEAMSYGLPVVGLDIYNTSEIIVNEKNGFLISPRNREPLYTKYNLPNSFSHSFLSEMRNSREQISKKLTDILEKLILDEKLRITIGKNAKDTIDLGNMSIKKRNSDLKKIFDESLENQG